MAKKETAASAWITFVRRYGPGPRNEHMYDETIQRAARRANIAPILFKHPWIDEVLAYFDGSQAPQQVILTGTAGDGKTYLCGKVWKALGGNEKEWHSDANYYQMQLPVQQGSTSTLHIVRDLTALGKNDEHKMGMSREDLLQTFSQAIFDRTTRDVFLIASNDGHLIETWRTLPNTPAVQQAQQLFETLLVEGYQDEQDIPLSFLNLTRGASVELFDLALEAFLAHSGWQECYANATGKQAFFGPQCPIRHNYELLQTTLVQKRLRALFELCDYNGLHIPIRQILLLLTNAVLGHSGCKDNLMKANDIAAIVRAGSQAQACIYNNIFGANLTESRREELPIFHHLNRFRIGYETTNRIDNILIFGKEDEGLHPYFTNLLEADSFYGIDQTYYDAQTHYVEANHEDEETSVAFLKQLVAHRQRIFFKIPPEQEQELRLWELTVFAYAGEYLHIVHTLKTGGRIETPIIHRMVRGLNRIFVGMLVASERELILATALAPSSSTKVSRILEARVSVRSHLGEKVVITLNNDTTFTTPVLNVVLAPTIQCPLVLNLVRYEFLSRVAEGTLPGSFSRECYEDIRAFKSQVLTALQQRREQQQEDEPPPATLTFNLLRLDSNGQPTDDLVEVLYEA